MILFSAWEHWTAPTLNISFSVRLAGAAIHTPRPRVLRRERDQVWSAPPHTRRRLETARRHDGTGPLPSHIRLRFVCGPIYVKFCPCLIVIQNHHQFQINLIYSILLFLVTIFTATNWEQSVKTLAKWIRVASITRADFGDNLGFFAIVSALGWITKNFRATRHSKDWKTCSTWLHTFITHKETIELNSNSVSSISFLGLS